ncbi:hypothetical protein BU15DRAFT_68481 [Melanogaster broomeanus]|nr:hypothetical protein BU15DRAFT_68481 [Melanogaster broomeanus]
MAPEESIHPIHVHALFDRNTNVFANYSASRSLLYATEPMVRNGMLPVSSGYRTIGSSHTSDAGSSMQSVRSPSVDSEDCVHGYLDGMVEPIAPVWEVLPRRLISLVTWMWIWISLIRSDMAAGSTSARHDSPAAGEHQVDITTPKAISAGVLRATVRWITKAVWHGSVGMVRFGGQHVCAALSPREPATLTIAYMQLIPIKQIEKQEMLTSNAQAVPDSNSRPLIDDADAWRLVLHPVFTKLFAAWELEDQNASGPIDIVKAAMSSRGVSFSDCGPRVSVSTNASADAHRIKRRKACRFLDVEARVDDGEQTSDEEDDRDSFIVPDDIDENRAMAPWGPRVYPPTTATAGPSRYSQAINTIVQCYGQMSTELDDGKTDMADEDEGEDEDENEDENEDEDEDMVVLDAAGIWEKIRDWITDDLPYETLLCHMDFQYEKYPKVQYWEDFVSTLAFETSIERREAHFVSMTLDQHHRLLSQYTSPIIPPPASPPSPLSSPAHTSSPPDSAKMWAVKIYPCERTFPKLLKRSDSIQASSVPYVVTSWNEVGISAMVQHKLLPGRVVVYAANPNTFLRALPKSHSTCMRTWTLVPLEDQINLFGAAEPSVPDRRTRRLFLPCLYEATSHPPLHGRARHKYKGDSFVAGLLLLKRKKTKVWPLAIPSPYQIALHVESMVNPVFMTASLHRYNQQFWKPDDHVVVCDAAHQGKCGVLHAISRETQSATCYFSVGDIVRIIEDPHSNIRNVHHRVMGKFGNVINVDVDTEEVTVYPRPVRRHFPLTNYTAQIRVPPFLLESYVPDQGILAAHGSIIPSVEDSPDVVEVGDTAEVQSRLHIGVQRATGWVQLQLLCPSTPCQTRTIDVPLSSITSTPPTNALRFSAATNYNVRKGDYVVVVRGESIGRNGIVSKVDHVGKTLDVAVTWNPSIVFTLPITHFAHGNVVSDRGDENRHRDVIVVRGCNTTLDGTALTPEQSFKIDGVFERAEIPQVTRMNTPPPTSSFLPDVADDPTAASTSSNPWTVDDDNIDEAEVRPVSSFGFLLCPGVVESLKTYHAVFKILPGWRDSYLDRHIKTEVPSPFWSPSGQPIPPNFLAVMLTERTKGAAQVHVNIPEQSLAPVAPPKKNTFCMVIESKEGGEEVGTVLLVTKSSKKEWMVDVKRLDDMRSNEDTLPWSRVIMVERPFQRVLEERSLVQTRHQDERESSRETSLEFLPDATNTIMGCPAYGRKGKKVNYNE